jgi:hypothetical protein
MLHRIVSRSVVVLAGTVFLAACEDNTAGTPLTPPPASTAVYVTAIEPADGYSIQPRTITIAGVDTVVNAVSPDPTFQVLLPDGSTPEGQVVTFNVNLPGFVEQTKDTVPASGIVTPGYWVVGNTCPDSLNPNPAFCRPVERVIATPVAGSTGFLDVVNVVTPPPPPPVRSPR